MKRAGFIACVALCLCVGSAFGGGFQQVFEAAQAYDPTYRAAQQELAAAVQGVPMARAGLLPNVSLSISDARINGSRTAENFLGQPVTAPLNYRSPQQTLSVRTPLFNQEARQRYLQAQLQLDYARSIFLSRTHELLDRLAQAYMQRLYADQGVLVVQKQLANARQQYLLALRRFELGDGTRPEVQVAQSDLAIAQVQLTEAENALAVAVLALTQIAGPAAGPLPAVHDLDPPFALVATQLEYWTDLANATNPSLVARRQAVELARLGVARASAGHYPRIDLVASISHARNDSVSTLNQSISQRSLGVQLNLPIYSGGFVDASTLQAVAEQEKAQAELEAELLRVQADLSRSLLTVVSGPARIAAQREAVAAARLSLEGARRGVAGGTAIAADVVRADSRVAEAARDLARARYEHVLARMRLHSRAGTAPHEIAAILDNLLHLAPSLAP